MNKRIISVLTAAVCAFGASGALCACGDNGGNNKKLTEEEWKAAITATLDAANVRPDLESGMDEKWENDECVETRTSSSVGVYLYDLNSDTSFSSSRYERCEKTVYKNDEEDEEEKSTSENYQYSKYVKSAINASTVYSVRAYRSILESPDYNSDTGEEYLVDNSYYDTDTELKEYQISRYQGYLNILSNDVFPDGDKKAFITDYYSHFEFNAKTGAYTTEVTVKEMTVKVYIKFTDGYVSEFGYRSSGEGNSDDGAYFNSQKVTIKLSGYGTTDTQSLLPDSQKQSILDKVAEKVQEIESMTDSGDDE